MRNHQWRDCKAWADEGLPVTTTSNEAAKYYDACLTQFIGWYDDPDVEGIVNSMGLLSKADPEFVLGLCINFGLKLVGTLESISTSKDLMDEFINLKSVCERNKSKLTHREQLHAKSILLWAEGQVSSATRIWEDILLDHPTDLHALKMANISYFYLGQSRHLTNSVARVLPIWEEKRPPLKSFLYGMYAFGLQETNEFQKAETFARKALFENPQDGWSTHSLAHIFESEGRTHEGLKFMNSTVQNWEHSNHIACHNHWHTALFHIENEDFESAIGVLDKEVLTRALESKTMLNIADCSSLLYRLEMLAVDKSNGKTLNLESHWPKVHEICKPYSKHHISTFNDAHFMMTFAGSGAQGRNCLDEILETVTAKSGKGDLANEIAESLLRSIAYFSDGKYDLVVSTLEPLRYRWNSIGGSHAQLDVFNLLLIVSALKSTEGKHRKLARGLINERIANKPETALSRRLQLMLNLKNGSD